MAKKKAKKKGIPAKQKHDRIVLLNTMLSVSNSRSAHHPPVLGALESMQILDSRRKRKIAIEFASLDESPLGKFKEDTRTEDQREAARIELGKGHDCVRLSAMRFEADDDYTYVTCLVEAIDPRSTSFAVVDLDTFDGREIAAKANERGSAAAHLMVRVPNDESEDMGKYRCAIETVHPITRLEIQNLFCRQLRRHSEATELTFPAIVSDHGKNEEKQFRYNPRLELVADVGRKLAFGEDKTLSHMIFTKRAEKQSIGKKTVVDHEEIEADVQLKISGSQGPDGTEQQKAWVEKLVKWYKEKDYDVRFYFRYANGTIEGGALHKAIAGATDILMCQRSQITLTKPPKPWVQAINSEIAQALRDLIDRDELWEYSK